MELIDLFKKYDDEYMKFDLVDNKFSRRPDLHAFVLLDRLLPGYGDIVSCAEHDEIWLDIEVEQLAKVATEDDIRDLVRCGVTYDEDVDSLSLFV